MNIEDLILLHFRIGFFIVVRLGFCILSFGFRKFEVCNVGAYQSRAYMQFFRIEEKNSMGHFKEIEFGLINIVFVRIGSKKGSTFFHTTLK